MLFRSDYTVLFQDDDGREISKRSYHYGETLLVPANPSKAADDTFTYEFAGWDSTPTATVVGSVTYTATYNEIYNNYTVTFVDYNDNVILTKSNYHFGDAVTAPADPVRPDDNTYTYLFTGWDAPVVNVNGNATYKAQYDETYLNYKVKFVDYNDAVLSSKTDYHFGDTVTAPADPVRAADNTYTYAFAGWDKAVVNVNGDAIYKATYTPTYINYTITFVDYNDNVILTKNNYHFGDTVTAPADPVRAADDTNTYAFAGWDKTVVNVNGDATYKATYTPTYIDYTVTFNAGDHGTLSGNTATASFTATYNQPWADVVTTVPAVTAESGWRFDGWDTTFPANVTGNITITAKYVKQYNVKFVIGSEGTVADGTTLEYTVDTDTPWSSSGITVPAVTTNENWRFEGWDTTIPASTDVINSDLTFTAQYKALYKVTYNLNGGTSTDSILLNGERAAESDTITFPTDFSNTGKGASFLYWESNKTKYTNPTFVMPASPIEFTAVWSYKDFRADYYVDNVNLGYNKWSYLDSSLALMDGQSTIAASTGTTTLEEYLKTVENGMYGKHYTFNGWTCVETGKTYAADGTLLDMMNLAAEGGKSLDDTSFDGLTFKAIMTPDTKYTVKYVSNNNSFTTDAQWEETVKTLANTGLSSVPDYTFNGWKDENGKVYQPNDVIDLTKLGKDITLTAVWVENGKYSVTYDLNGASGTAPSQDPVYGDAAITVAAAPSRDGYTFTGWSDGTNTYQAGASYTMNNANVVFKAQWAAANYSIVVSHVYGTTTVTADTVSASFDTISNGYTVRKANRGYYTQVSGLTVNGTALSAADFYKITASDALKSFNNTIEVVFTYRYVPVDSDDRGSDEYVPGSSDNAGDSASTLTNIVDTNVPLASMFTSEHKEYVEGYPDKTFGPDRLVTREEVAEMFYKLLKDDYKAALTSEEVKFSDIDKNSWSYPAIAALYNAGILSGYPDGTFKSENNITRAEFATIAYKFDDLPVTSGNAFTDCEGHWAEAKINAAANKGWIHGYGNGTFGPENNITRSEVVTLINNVLGRSYPASSIPDGANTWTDVNPGDWFYYPVMEAGNTHEYQIDAINKVENWGALYNTK